MDIRVDNFCEKTNEVQKVSLDIFKEIKKICDKYNFRYFAIGGTCIGAIRHKGFIPWDDDLDIAMPNKDYCKFIEIADKELPSHIKLHHSMNMENGILVFTKVHNVNTAFIECVDENYPKCYRGVFVDVMPMYGVPENVFMQKIYAFRLKWLLHLNTRRNRDFYCDNNKGLKYILKRVFYILTYPLKFLTKFNYFSNKWLELVSKYDFDSSKYVGYVWSENIGRLMFPQKWFEKTIAIPFEDTTMNCPLEYNLYLSKQFGDYMQLPPIEQRITGHIGTIDLKKSYKCYQNVRR